MGSIRYWCLEWRIPSFVTLVDSGRPRPSKQIVDRDRSLGGLETVVYAGHVAHDRSAVLIGYSDEYMGSGAPAVKSDSHVCLRMRTVNRWRNSNDENQVEVSVHADGMIQ